VLFVSFFLVNIYFKFKLLCFHIDLTFLFLILPWGETTSWVIRVRKEGKG
jgi:hypothetical protein